MTSQCRECDELQKTGLKIDGNQMKVNKYRNHVLVGCGMFVGTVFGLTIPFISPAFRKICLPYVPATDVQVENVFQILKKFRCKGSLIDLGSGDGRIVIAASQRNYRAVGVELNYPLVLYSRVRNLLSKTSAKFYRRNIWKIDLSGYDNIVIFGVDSMMQQLEDKIKAEVSTNSCIVVCRFPLPGLTPLAQVGEGIDTVWLYRNVNP